MVTRIYVHLQSVDVSAVSVVCTRPFLFLSLRLLYHYYFMYFGTTKCRNTGNIALSQDKEWSVMNYNYALKMKKGK